MKRRYIVDHVEGAVGTGRDIHRPKPFVGTREKLTVGMRPSCLQARASGLDFPPRHERGSGFADKQVAGKVVAEQIAAVKPGAACGG